MSDPQRGARPRVTDIAQQAARYQPICGIPMPHLRMVSKTLRMLPDRVSSGPRRGKHSIYAKSGRRGRCVWYLHIPFSLRHDIPLWYDKVAAERDLSKYNKEAVYDFLQGGNFTIILQHDGTGRCVANDSAFIRGSSSATS